MSWMANLPQDDVAAIEAETRGEIVHWAGKPDAGRAFFYAFGIYAMGVPWSALAFAIFGALAASVLSVAMGETADRTIPPGEYAIMAAALVFTSVFVAIGVAMLAAPFWVLARARRTAHAITDKRILTIIGGQPREVASVDPRTIVKTVRRERGDGSGTLTIFTGFEKDRDGDLVAKSEKLFSVRDVKAAELAIEALRRNDARR